MPAVLFFCYMHCIGGVSWPARFVVYLSVDCAAQSRTGAKGGEARQAVFSEWRCMQTVSVGLQCLDE